MRKWGSYVWVGIAFFAVNGSAGCHLDRSAGRSGAAATAGRGAAATGGGGATATGGGGATATGGGAASGAAGAAGEPAGAHRLTIRIESPPPQSFVTSDPPGIDCQQTTPSATTSGQCSAMFPDGTQLSLHAGSHVAAGFRGWSEDCMAAGAAAFMQRGTDTDINIVIDRDMLCVARFGQ